MSDVEIAKRDTIFFLDRYGIIPETLSARVVAARTICVLIAYIHVAESKKVRPVYSAFITHTAVF